MTRDVGLAGWSNVSKTRIKQISKMSDVDILNKQHKLLKRIRLLEGKINILQKKHDEYSFVHQIEIDMLGDR